MNQKLGPSQILCSVYDVTVTEGLRERKKRDTRQRLSDIATVMFIERGFDNVSVAEIAEAAGVSKMTVFNYFPRKEDLFFDRGAEFVELVTGAIRDRAPGVTPVAALGALMLRLLDERHPLAAVRDQYPAFWNVVLASPALRARAREAVVDAETLIGHLIAEAEGRPPEDPQIRLTAALVMATARICYETAARRIMAGEKADDIFPEHRAFVERAFSGLA
jgi:AcrR family transcriptional regulator